MAIFMILILIANFLFALVNNILAIMVLDSIALPIILWIETEREEIY